MLHVNFIQVKDSVDMGKAAADEFEAVIQAKPSCVIGLATGSTPIPLYRELILRERAGRIDFSRVRSVNLDEYKGLPRENEQSYYRFMHENLFDHINISPDPEGAFYQDFVAELSTYPTTCIVDRAGNIVGADIVGNVKKQLDTVEARLDLILAEQDT